MTALPRILTKIRPPVGFGTGPVRGDLVARFRPQQDRLLGALRAPTGFGKTTLLASLIASGEYAFTAWLTLDDDDNDPARLWDYLGAALNDLVTPSEARFTRDAVLNAVASAPDRSLLVVDELEHLTDRESIEVLRDLVRYGAPGLSVVVGAQHDPGLFEPFRGKVQTVELDVDDLRLGPSDVSNTAGQVGLDVSDDEAATLVAATNGWPAAVQLAVRSGSTADQVLAAATGEAFNRWATAVLFDPLEPALQEFLIQTRVLEALHASLCDAVRDATDSTERILELVQRGLFVSDLGGGWYRLHDVFRHVLGRIDPDLDQSEAHRRASDWFADDHNHDEAVRHMIASADWASAGRLMFRYLLAYERDGRTATLRAWFDQLPEHARYEPTTALGCAWNLTTCGQPAAALQWIDRFVGEGRLDESHGGELELIRSVALRMLGRYDESIQAACDALTVVSKLAPVPESGQRYGPYINATAQLQQVDIALWREQFAPALDALAGAERDVLDARSELALVRFRCLFALAQFLGGRIADAQNEAELAARLAHRSAVGETHAVAEAFVVDAAARWETDSGDGFDAVREAYSLSARSHFPSSRGQVLQLAAETAASMGELDWAKDVATELFDVAQHVGDPIGRGRGAATMAEIALRAGDLDEATSWLRFLASLPATVPSVEVTRSRIQSWLDRPTDALRTITAIESGRQPIDGRLAVLIELQMSNALAGVGDETGSSNRLSAALSRAEHIGLLRTVAERIDIDGPLVAQVANDPHAVSVRYLRRLRRLTLPQPYQRADPLLDVLTEREVAVADLLDSRLSSHQIAETLFISNNTVKTHLRNIYRKLSVSDRDSAVKRLDELRRAGSA